MIVKLLTEYHLEFLRVKGGCRGSSESTHVKLLEISCRGSFKIKFMPAGNRNTSKDHDSSLHLP